MQTRAAGETPQLRNVSAGDVSIAVWEWAGESPPIIFVHATGFHGRLWDSVIGLLPARRIYSIELRGHGRSSKPEPPYRWRAFGRDVAGVARALALTGAIGIGHSSGGHAMALAASLAPEAFRQLLLIDPTVFPEERYGAAKLDASFTLRRKNDWGSATEMIERFRDRKPFAAWKPEVLADYCQYGLLPDGGRFVLACPPSVEASIYAESNAPESNIYPEIGAVAAPVTVMRAGAVRQPGALDLSASPTAPDLAARFRNGRDIVLPDRSHFIPMEAPERVAEEISRLA